MEKKNKRVVKQIQSPKSLQSNSKFLLASSDLEFREPLDGFKRPQNSQNSEGLYCFDVSAFVVSVDIEIKY